MIKLILGMSLATFSFSTSAYHVLDISVEASKDEEIVYAPLLKVKAGNEATFKLDDKNKMTVIANVSNSGLVETETSFIIDGEVYSPSFKSKIGEVVTFTSNEVKLTLKVNKD